MNILFVSPVGTYSPHLFGTFEETFLEQGHTISDAHNADVVLFDFHNALYGHSYDAELMREVMQRRLPIACFCDFDFIGTPHSRCDFWGFDDWRMLRTNPRYAHEEWAQWLLKFIGSGQLKVLFVRKMQRSHRHEYPAVCRPIDRVFYNTHLFPEASLDDFASRTVDFCWIGNTSPWRGNACVGLVRHGFKADVYFPYVRIPHDEWLNRYRCSRFFIEADGGGFGSERVQQLTLITALCYVQSDHNLAHPFTDGENCIIVGNEMGELSDDDALKMRHYLQPREAHRLYLGGREHIQAHFSERAIALYVLQCLREAGI